MEQNQTKQNLRGFYGACHESTQYYITHLRRIDDKNINIVRQSRNDKKTVTINYITPRDLRERIPSFCHIKHVTN